MIKYAIVFTDFRLVNDFVERNAKATPEWFELVSVEGMLSTPPGYLAERYIVTYIASEPRS